MKIISSMSNKHEEYIDRTLGMFAGVMFLVIGIIAFLTDLSKVGAVLLITMGIGGSILTFRKPRNGDEII